jgi:Fis family transcriptional regulator
MNLLETCDDQVRAVTTGSTHWPTPSPAARHERGSQRRHPRTTSMSKKAHRRMHPRQPRSYFKDLRGVEPTAMYEMILNVVEKPLLDVVMKHAEGNQSRAAEWLGINRNTLRRKLRRPQADQMT